MPVPAPSSAVSTVRERPDLAGYYAVMTLVVALFVALWLFEGHYLFTAWFPSLFDEITPINGVAAGAFMTLMLACAITALVRPAAIGPSRVLVVGGGLFGTTIPLAFVASEPVVAVGLFAVAASILVAVVRLHPARSALLPSRETTIDPALLGLTAVLAVPFVWTAVEFQWWQITRDDEVATRWFYGGYSLYLLAVVSVAAVAAGWASTRRFAAATAAFLAGALGLVSVVYPTALHSLGTVGGGLLLAWSVTVGALALRN